MGHKIKALAAVVVTMVAIAGCGGQNSTDKQCHKLWAQAQNDAQSFVARFGNDGGVAKADFQLAVTAKGLSCPRP